MKLNVVLDDEDEKRLREIGKNTNKPYSSLVREWINEAHSKLIFEKNDMTLTKLSRIETLEFKNRSYKEQITDMKKEWKVFQKWIETIKRERTEEMKDLKRLKELLKISKPKTLDGFT